MTAFPGFSAPAAGMDEPLAMLAACHERIERQCSTLQRLAAHLAVNGADPAARTAAGGVIRYFTSAALDHHADEETDLFPALLEAVAGSDAVCLRALIESLAAEHAVLASHWQRLQPLLEKVGAGDTPPAGVLADVVTAFTADYRAHIERENGELLPMAARLLAPDQIARLGQAMSERRRISPA
jgi:hemerythrin-like domain-containing protein